MALETETIDPGDYGDHDEYSTLKEELLSYILEAEQSLKTKTVLWERNVNAASQRPSTVEIARRDPSVKKNSGFIKKLRVFGAGHADILMNEYRTLNLSMYLSEAATAIVEAKIKFTDIPFAVLLCTELNCTYPDFINFLQEEYIKVLTINKNEPIANTNRLRVELCFYAELSICGVIPARQSLPVLGTALTALTADKTFDTLNLILSFCKHCGSDFAGLVPRRIRLLSDQFNETLSRSTLLSTSKQESVKKLLLDYYTSLCQHIHKVMRAEIQTLFSGAATLAELLDVELPDLPDTDLQDVILGDEDCSGRHVWEDEETRMFYTQLPDVKDYLTQLGGQEEGKDKTTKKDSDLFKSDDPKSPSNKSTIDTFLKLLPECCTQLKIDNAALEFLIYFNSKLGRKKLVMYAAIIEIYVN